MNELAIKTLTEPQTASTQETVNATLGFDSAGHIKSSNQESSASRDTRVFHLITGAIGVTAFTAAAVASLVFLGTVSTTALLAVLTTVVLAGLAVATLSVSCLGIAVAKSWNAAEQ